MSLACFALFVLVALGVPTAFMWPYLREEKLFWPGMTVIERSRVDVSGGAFRATTAQIEAQREVAPGMPLGVQLTSFMGLFIGQIFPIVALYVFMGVFGVLATFAEGGSRKGAAMLVLELGGVAWTLGARSAWKGAHAVLGAHTAEATMWLRRSIIGHALALLGGVGATFIAGTFRSTDVLVLMAPFALALLVSIAQRAMFNKHRVRLPESVGAPHVDPATGFVLSGVRVVDPMATPSASAHEAEQQSVEHERNHGERK